MVARSLGFGIVQSPFIAGRQVERGQVAGIGKGGIVLAYLLLVTGDTQGVVVQQSLFQTGFQGIDRCWLCLDGKRGAQNDQKDKSVRFIRSSVYFGW